VWQNLVFNFQKIALIDNEHMAPLEACYGLMAKHIVTLIRVFATQTEYVQEVLRGMCIHPLGGGELPSALATCAVV